MTEAQWLASNDPAAMLAWANKPGSCGGRAWSEWKPCNRQLLLFMCACQRLDGQHDAARYFEEQADDPTGDNADLRLAQYDAMRWALLDAEPSPTRHAMRTAIMANLLRDVVGNPFRPVTRVYETTDESPTYWQQFHVRKQVLYIAEVAYAERNPDGTLDPDRLAVLSDALEDAGCPMDVEETEIITVVAGNRCPQCNDYGFWRSGVGFEHEKKCGKCDMVWEPGESCQIEKKCRVPHPLLAHLRDATHPHVRGCWAVDLLAGKE